MGAHDEGIKVRIYLSWESRSVPIEDARRTLGFPCAQDLVEMLGDLEGVVKDLSPGLLGWSEEGDVEEGPHHVTNL
jgi:hypothetical protein